MYRYTAYGLGIQSEVRLPELSVAETAPDVVLRRRRLEGLTQTENVCGHRFVGEAANVGTFLVQDGREIIVDPVPGVDEALLRTIMLGPILSVLLRQRNLLVLHASGAVVNGAVVAFLGGSGSGKSTLAEVFYTQGYGVAVDDVLAINIETGAPTVLPGYPHIKLLPDAAASLGYALERLPLLHSQSEKRVHSIPRGFPQAPLPLKRLYVLTTSTHNAIVPLRPQEAFVELVRHSRAVGLLNTPYFVQSHMHQCARLVEAVTICRLERQLSFASTVNIPKLVVQDLT